MKDAGIFLGRENNRGIFLCIVFFISSIKNKISTIYSFVFDQTKVEVGMF